MIYVHSTASNVLEKGVNPKKPHTSKNLRSEKKKSFPSILSYWSKIYKEKLNITACKNKSKQVFSSENIFIFEETGKKSAISVRETK